MFHNPPRLDSGNLFCLDVDDGLHSVNIATGATSQVGVSSGRNTEYQSLEYEATSGKMLAAGDNFFEIDTTTNVARNVGSTGYDIRGLFLGPP